MSIIDINCNCGCGARNGVCRFDPRAERWRYKPLCDCERACFHLGGVKPANNPKAPIIFGIQMKLVDDAIPVGDAWFYRWVLQIGDCQWTVSSFDRPEAGGVPVEEQVRKIERDIRDTHCALGCLIARHHDR